MLPTIARLTVLKHHGCVYAARRVLFAHHPVHTPVPRFSCRSTLLIPTSTRRLTHFFCCLAARLRYPLPHAAAARHPSRLRCTLGRCADMPFTAACLLRLRDVDSSTQGPSLDDWLEHRRFLRVAALPRYPRLLVRTRRTTLSTLFGPLPSRTALLTLHLFRTV